jgi:hypothetical protein
VVQTEPHEVLYGLLLRPGLDPGSIDVFDAKPQDPLPGTH